jgi:hypothetical protein
VYKGDPDTTADEIQGAIDRAEGKRQGSRRSYPRRNNPPKCFRSFPVPRTRYCRQITLGLEGDPRAALRARVCPREWFGGKIRLEPVPDGGLMAHWSQCSSALLKNLGVLSNTYDSLFRRHRWGTK